MSGYCDAHCHLQDPRLEDRLEAIVTECRAQDIVKMVVNGTQESDWDTVADLAVRFPGLVIPSYGLHPWWSRERSGSWLEALEQRLRSEPHAHVGETGLDRWMDEPDPIDQEAVLRAHLDLAVRYDRAISLHCLRAWGQLLDVLKSQPLPRRGFLLHSYGGPAEMVRTFADLGAYFSFPGYFLGKAKEKKQAAFREVPEDRLLFETDAPDQLLPEELDRYTLSDSASGRRLNHPANLPVIYEHDPAASPETIARNFHRLFA
jgi:TatD DNase family protein